MSLVLALLILPMCLIIGFSVDISKYQSSSLQVQSSLDSSVLAAARSLQLDGSDESVKAEAASFFQASLGANKSLAECGDVAIDIYRDEQKVFGSVKCQMPTIIANLTGVDELSFNRESESFFGIGKLDIAFVFDTSGSMGSENRIQDLKVAAVDAVTTILASDNSGNGNVRIAISTYATSLNVGETYFQAVTDAEPNRKECKKWKKGGKCSRYGYVTKTCVTGREGTQKYTDVAPGNGSWIAYETTDCNSATITPLTTNKDMLVTQINSLPASGYTAGHLGIAWAWYLISPNWSSIWPVESAPIEYDLTVGRKIVVMMTDGAFNTDYMSGGDSFAHAQQFCDAMKAEDVLIYTVSFKAPVEGQAVLNYCATSSEYAFTAESGAELKAAYEAIASDISKLRLTH